MASTFSRTSRLSLVAALLLIGTACDNPIEPEDHPEAGGVVILDAGTGAVLALSVGALTAFDRPLNLSVAQVLEAEVKFLDADDPDDLDLAFHPHADEGESLNVIITNDAIVEYHDHGDHGDFEAQSAGQTTITFELFHGSHADFRSGPLTVVVQ